MKRHSLPLPPPRELAQVISTRLLRTLARLTVDDVDGRAAVGGGGEGSGRARTYMRGILPVVCRRRRVAMKPVARRGSGQ